MQNAAIRLLGLNTSEIKQQAADMMWAISTGFGAHTPQQWLQLSEAMVKPLPEGGFTLHYDPAIAVPTCGTRSRKWRSERSLSARRLAAKWRRR